MSPADKSLKRPARETRSGRKILLPLFVELLHILILYCKHTQNRAEKPVCIFISMGGQDILSAPVCAQADALAYRQV